MKIGLLARSENRGLGIQSWEFARHMPIDRVLIVDMGELAKGFERHDERYHELGCRVDVVTWAPGGFVEELIVREWLEGLDVVFSVETLYDPLFHEWAEEAHVATVVQLNPEFIKPDLFKPTAWWAPSPWRFDRLGVPARLVPVPVATDRFSGAAPAETDGPLRVLHVVGHRAAADRNGTQLFCQALRYLSTAIHVRVMTQDDRILPLRPRSQLTVETVVQGVEDYWSLYDDADVLVIPRRYGGLCLPAQEGMAAGLALVMTDCPPNDFWPALLAPARQRGSMRTPGGLIATWEAAPRNLAALITQLSSNRSFLHERQQLALDWANEHSWPNMTPLYLEEFERAVADVRR